MRECFEGRRNEPNPWPARSPHLNPFDFVLLYHLKCVIYETPGENESDLSHRIINDSQQNIHTKIFSLAGRWL